MNSSGVDRSCVIIALELAHHDHVFLAAQTLSGEGYRIVLMGAPSLVGSALDDWGRRGLEVSAMAGPADKILDALRPAIAVTGPQDAAVGLSVPNRLVVSPTPLPVPPEVECITDLAQWSTDYLSPRVPRNTF